MRYFPSVAKSHLLNIILIDSELYLLYLSFLLLNSPLKLLNPTLAPRSQELENAFAGGIF